MTPRHFPTHQHASWMSRSDKTPSPIPSSVQDLLCVANAPGPASKRLKSTKFGVRSRPSKTLQDPTIDVKPLIAEQCPNEPNGVATDFRTALYKYGKAIIESAMDHDPERVSSLGNNMVTAKAKIIGMYDVIAKELNECKADSTREKERNERLHKELVKESSEKSEVENDLGNERDKTSTLRKDLESALREKEEYKVLSQKTLLDLCQSRRECEKLESENNRKRHRPEEIWEKVESVKMVMVIPNSMSQAQAEQ